MCLMLLIKLNSSQKELFILFPVYVLQVPMMWLALRIHKAAEEPVISIMLHSLYTAK